MSFFGALQISATGMSAERTRMDVASENLANANSTSGTNGAYHRKEVVLKSETGTGGFAQALASVANIQGTGGIGSTNADIGTTDGGVEVAGIVDDKTPNRLVYDPGHPDANAKGYVSMPNVNPVVEMTDLISSSRAYEANVNAMQTSKTMISRVMDILK
jgi:flagellar basal-body rod protein FlgC